MVLDRRTQGLRTPVLTAWQRSSEFWVLSSQLFSYSEREEQERRDKLGIRMGTSEFFLSPAYRLTEENQTGLSLCIVMLIGTHICANDERDGGRLYPC